MDAPAIGLRPVQRTDLETLFAHQADQVACEAAGFTSRDHPAFMKHWHKILADPQGLALAIEDQQQIRANPMGYIVSFEIDGRREVGYWLGREYWGRGLATEALRGFLGVETIRPLYAGVAAHNHASVRVLEKCGFVRIPEDAEELLLVLR